MPKREISAEAQPSSDVPGLNAVPATDRDVVIGGQAIADVTGLGGSVYHHLRQGHVPGSFRIGQVWGLSLPVWRRHVHGEG